ncbi:sulfate/molybdate ABC transporter ATP-binding protein [Hespellia stercorisuis]|uniref:Molybdate transport system ATP-binding protein n=1 Tax=Hespellia stercorisuis DSM 15480 TaxID=1121950 RepID=A0A1M6UDJ6_9FIRM|nr:ATP-binding cassette domain-containing protein [Hespellia stercorisuis]SHK67249.1 molybdate transport system ATP-binding protein [Hespellia stercorisuis DSM 15480]
MPLKIRLKKQFNSFLLDVKIESESRRIGILGASGCGKSMTLRGIAGVQDVDEGYIEVNGKVLLDAAKKINIKPQKRHIGYLFQNYALFPTMSVEQNVMAGLHGGKEENRARTAAMLEKFQLKGLEKRLPGELSGGQQQRVALARIMAYQPDMILLDEPFSALDGFLSDRLQQELLEMLEDYEGTVILVSHNRDEIYRFSEELLIMQEGQMICQGKTKKMFADPQKKAAARLTGCKNITGVTLRDEHSFWIPEWGITVKSQTAIPTRTDCIGYRAHEFIPVWGERAENCIPFRLKSMAELPFERKYFLDIGNAPENKTQREEAGSEEICWFVQRDLWPELETRGLPDYLQIDIEKILYLTEN